MTWVDALVSRPAAVTIGKFDGVHIGHQRIIEQLVDAAGDLERVVVTFDRHPLTLLQPERAPLPLISVAQKEQLLRAYGVDRVVTMPFTRETAAMSPESFAIDVLLDGIGARRILVGSDFRFGARGAGDVAMLSRLAAERGAEVVVIDDVCARDGRRVSSTWIRDSLALGRVEEATEMLGRPPQLRGTVVRGHQRGRALGFPTANLEQQPEGFVPADGVYAAWATVDAGRFMAAVSIGDNPTFDGVHKTVEAYLLDADLDLYDRPMTLDLTAFVRPMHRFDGLDALIEQMRRDVDEVREILSA